MTGATSRTLVAALIVVGALTRLPSLTHPREVVFDEATFGKFVSAYCGTGTRMFDVHPPHGKLLISAGAALGGYRGGFSFDRIGQPYGDAPVFALRVVPAIAGILIPPLFLLLLRQLGASLPAAFFGGLLLALDNALLLETRIIVFDGLLVAATLGSLVALIAAGRTKSTRRGDALTALGGALAGFAVGVKFTGLLAVLLAGIVILTSPRVRGRWRWPVRRAIVAAAAAAVVYLGGWWVHFALLTQPGPADAFHVTTGRFVEDLVVTHRTMFAANVNMTTPSLDASPAWTWPLMKVAPYFWTASAGQPTAFIYLVGNPVIWWGGSLLFVMLVAGSVTAWVRGGRPARLARRSLERRRPVRTWLPLVAYAAAYLPLFPVTRVLFLYHYLTPLVFSLAYVVLRLDEAGWARDTDSPAVPPRYYLAIAVVLAGFLVVSPVTYGIPAGGYDDWLAQVIRSWR